MSSDFLRGEVARWERETGARAETAVLTGPSDRLSLQEWARGVALWELLEDARDGA
jgi:hypothetical protein